MRQYATHVLNRDSYWYDLLTPGNCSGPRHSAPRRACAWKRCWSSNVSWVRKNCYRRRGGNWDALLEGAAESEFDVSLMAQIPLQFARNRSWCRLEAGWRRPGDHEGQALNLQPLDDVSAILKAPVEPILSPEAGSHRSPESRMTRAHRRRPRSSRIWTIKPWVAGP